ncbi:HAD family phosphatase [Pseudoruegeria sp. SK021]|uniref:HAD family hydrolase n=1 Tax=Pseudoruegeria sp. SK021 TaxID=1933035 RepID=UPI000A236005|nr:HAD family phosphatase [Pseudoruegeria sp. SK021]OSP56782.1 haloacid dehalogenase [Pseudoruegeria sp. SK021]
MSIEAVIFDIGNVLIEWQPERFYDAAIGRDRREAMFAAVDLHAMNDLVDRGENFQTTVYATAEEYPDFAAEIRMWHDNWIEMASPAIPGSIELLRALKAKGVPVFALSNFGIESFEYAETKYDFLGEFDRRYVSGHMGVIKPDPEIYEIVELDTGIKPAGLLFTDDRMDNIRVAEGRGWATHLFEGPEGWARKLVEQGLLTTAEAGLAPGTA